MTKRNLGKRQPTKRKPKPRTCKVEIQAHVSNGSGPAKRIVAVHALPRSIKDAVLLLGERKAFKHLIQNLIIEIQSNMRSNARKHKTLTYVDEILGRDS